MRLPTELDGLREQVELRLEEFLPPADRLPDTLSRAIRYSLFPGGKRLRPVLTLVANRALGGREDLAMPAACAIEMIHTYSLIHDDLPAMDDDDLRRGRATSHRVFGEGIAILTGDALLSISFQVLGRFPAGESHDPLRSRIFEEISEAASAEQMIAGQVLDLEMTGRTFDQKILETIHRRKTGALITASVVAGALAANAGPEAVNRIRTYGEAIGLAFQIVDDLLDVVGTEESLGKSAGKDACSSKATFPALMGLKESRQRAAGLVEEACAAVSPFGPEASLLVRLARSVLDRSR